ncbi:MAG TPA: DUF952 domain-containing protein [Acidimicrobiales bacterium]|nr:DUF952 domain-containing protein [Acidimicrobiales bacterium]
MSGPTPDARSDASPEATTVHHLLTPDEWTAAERRGHIAPTSLATEGFVHCSTASQLAGVVARHYAGVAELVVATIDPDRLAAELRWEESHPGDWYPHVYGPIGLDAVIDVRPWSPG